MFGLVISDNPVFVTAEYNLIQGRFQHGILVTTGTTPARARLWNNTVQQTGRSTASGNASAVFVVSAAQLEVRNNLFAYTNAGPARVGLPAQRRDARRLLRRRYQLVREPRSRTRCAWPGTARASRFASGAHSRGRTPRASTLRRRPSPRTAAWPRRTWAPPSGMRSASRTTSRARRCPRAPPDIGAFQRRPDARVDPRDARSRPRACTTPGSGTHMCVPDPECAAAYRLSGVAFEIAVSAPGTEATTRRLPRTAGFTIVFENVPLFVE